MAKKGIFISLEGIEGCGKSTQSKLLAQYFRKLGYCVILTREPGGTPIGEKIRDLLLDPKNDNMASITELLLYLASRTQHIIEVISPALSAGKIVICERFNDATLAYQGYARGLELDRVWKLINLATYGLEPDLTIVLDLDVKDGLARAEGRSNHKDRLESEDLIFHNKVRQGYHDIARKWTKRVKLIDANGSIDEVQTRIRESIKENIQF
ncbi:MAG: dTMP kinase [bacterium]